MTDATSLPIDLTAYRHSPKEQERIADLMRLVPPGVGNAIDIGARDGFLSRLLARRARHVTALDLERPAFVHPGVECVAGDVTKLREQYPDDHFHLTFCAEVLEHVPDIEMACDQISRVTQEWLIVGVPYRQDIRHGRLTCNHCGTINPPWGHVNTFDEQRLAKLFPKFEVVSTSFVGSTKERTNWLATKMMDWAGNPYGGYSQDEGCIACGKRMQAPTDTTLILKVATKLAFHLQRLHTACSRPHGNWIHVLMQRPVKSPAC
jgi:ubiquinone/menaquinone biosynthesis C-methylase UbiE